MKKLLVCAALAGAGALAHSADIPLYASGPSQDAAFVRFVNARTDALEVSAAGSKTRTQLAPSEPATPFFSVDASAKVKGQFQAGSQQSAVTLTVKPGEFATVVALPGGESIRQQVLREQPDDFNALKVSLALYNLDPHCGAAGLSVVGRSAALFDGVAAGALKRRVLNPVNISVQLLCKGQPTPTTLALGALVAGQRYSVFVVAAGPSAGTNAAPRLFIANDRVAR